MKSGHDPYGGRVNQSEEDKRGEEKGGDAGKYKSQKVCAQRIKVQDGEELKTQKM